MRLLTAGSAAFCGGMNAQCDSYFAPCSIQVRRSSTSRAGNGIMSQVCGRHAQRFVRARDAFVDFTLLRISGHYGVSPALQSSLGIGFDVEPEVRLPIAFVRTMTRETTVREDRSDVPIEMNLRRKRYCWTEQHEGKQRYEARRNVGHADNTSLSVPAFFRVSSKASAWNRYLRI